MIKIFFDSLCGVIRAMAMCALNSKQCISANDKSKKEIHIANEHTQQNQIKRARERVNKPNKPKPKPIAIDAKKKANGNPS